MDETFRLVFVWPTSTPSAASYASDEARPYEHLRDAVTAAHKDMTVEGAPYISYKHTVLDPYTIDLIYRQFIEETVTASS